MNWRRRSRRRWWNDVSDPSLGKVGQFGMEREKLELRVRVRGLRQLLSIPLGNYQPLSPLTHPRLHG